MEGGYVTRCAKRSVLPRIGLLMKSLPISAGFERTADSTPPTCRARGARQGGRATARWGWTCRATVSAAFSSGWTRSFLTELSHGTAASAGIIKHHPPPFQPNQVDEILAFYNEHGYVVVETLSEQEVAELNAVCDGWYEERGADIDVPGQGQLFFPLLNYPEFDQTIFHPSSLPLVGAILGGVENVRHIEFNFRGWQPVTSDYGMSWHPDDCSGGLLTLEQRQTRSPYGPPDMLSTFTYLPDVDETTPAFAVIPKSRRTDNIQQLRDDLGEEYGVRQPALFAQNWPWVCLNRAIIE